MYKKTFDCVEMRREIRNSLLMETNFDFKKLIALVKANNKISPLYKKIIEMQDKIDQRAN